MRSDRQLKAAWDEAERAARALGQGEAGCSPARQRLESAQLALRREWEEILARKRRGIVTDNGSVDLFCRIVREQSVQHGLVLELTVQQLPAGPDLITRAASILVQPRPESEPTAARHLHRFGEVVSAEVSRLDDAALLPVSNAGCKEDTFLVVPAGRDLKGLAIFWLANLCPWSPPPARRARSNRAAR